MTALIPRAGGMRRFSNPMNSGLPADRANTRTDRKPWTQSCSHHQRETRPRTLGPMCIDETITRSLPHHRQPDHENQSAGGFSPGSSAAESRPAETPRAVSSRQTATQAIPTQTPRKLSLSGMSFTDCHICSLFLQTRSPAIIQFKTNRYPPCHWHFIILSKRPENSRKPTPLHRIKLV